MARAKKLSTSAAPTLNADFWQQFGLVAEPNTRDKLLFLAFAEISRRGILDVNSRWLTDSLDIDASLVNYHFGSFDGLIAEVFITAHDIWAKSVADALALPAEDPESRLRNVMNGQLKRADLFDSVIGLAHLPNVSENVEAILNAQHPQKLSGVLTYVLAVTAVLIRDLRSGQMSPIEFTADNPPAERVIAEMPAELTSAAELQWSLVGPTLWLTGRAGGAHHLPAAPSELDPAQLMVAFVERLIRNAKDDRPAR